MPGMNIKGDLFRNKELTLLSLSQSLRLVKPMSSACFCVVPLTSYNLRSLSLYLFDFGEVVLETRPIPKNDRDTKYSYLGLNAQILALRVKSRQSFLLCFLTEMTTFWSTPRSAAPTPVFCDPDSS